MSQATPNANLTLRSQRQPLRQRLLTTLVPSILVPLFIAGFLGYTTARNRGRDAELANLKKESNLTADNINALFEEKLRVADTIGQSPSIRSTFRRVQEQVNSNGLVNKEIKLLEQQFGNTKQLPGYTDINEYLREIIQTNDLVEAFITDRNGFTIASSSTTSDFVQRDESWWQIAEQRGQSIDEFKLDASTQANVVALSRKITNPGTGEFLGMIKLSSGTEGVSQTLLQATQKNLVRSQRVQIVDAPTGRVISTITPSEVALSTEESQKLIGEDLIQKVAMSIFDRSRTITTAEEMATYQQQLNKLGGGFRVISLNTTDGESGQKQLTGAVIQAPNRYYSFTIVPGTSAISISSASTDDVEIAGRDLLGIFAGASWLLGATATILVLWLSRQLSKPLSDLTATAEAVAAGDMSVRAQLQGTAETETLAQGMNNLLGQVETLLDTQQKSAEDQRKQREELENDIVQLMEDVGEAAVGDLTVRAQLSAGDVGIVADLFNSIIENLRDTALQVKTSSGQVSTSLDVNAEAIRSLASQAIAEAESLRSTMGAVEQMSDSIQVVAGSAEQASSLTNETYATVQDSSQYMDQAVNSILNLRSTVGETAKKIKRLGESAQKISQTVSLIDEIALKTNLLAVNASVEAARAGELGQGFTAVAEQVGALAEQSASATKEIAQIVSAIQAETQEVVAAIETGTAQVVDSTKLVEATKQRLTQVLEKSEQINQLMRSISTSTIAQTEASATVTELVKRATVESEQRSQSSEQMARAIQDTAEIARSLQDSVAQFKVADGSDSEPGPTQPDLNNVEPAILEAIS
jgi:methyl-accepting chemotaxis protein PixJ